MTSPKLVVLSLAIVCSIFSTASEQTADHDSMQTMSAIQPTIQTTAIYDEIDNIDINMETRTNSAKKDKISVKDNNSLLLKNNYNIDKDEVYTKHQIHKDMLDKYRIEHNGGKMRQYDNNIKESKRNRRDLNKEAKCETFVEKERQLVHPHDKNSAEKLYYNGTDCTTVIAALDAHVIKLTFVDIFHIEEGPDGTCPYDFLEIRDGPQGYSKLITKICGSTFPPQLISTGPYLWLKFHSDETIEYEGFHINIEYVGVSSKNIRPESCNKTMGGSGGEIKSSDIDKECLDDSKEKDLEAIWTIITAPGTKIYLNFTHYELAKPNDCEGNVVQVYGYILEEDSDSRLAHYCGSVANPVTTKSDVKKGEPGNIMYIRLYASKGAKKSAFTAKYTAYRTFEPSKGETCNEDEWDCEDNTCIDIGLKCNEYADCRLKADEEPTICKHETTSLVKETHIVVILVIFSLILSGMSFVFLFKCVRKLYQDHKIIKEHIRQSTEDRLDRIVEIDSRFPLDAKRLERSSEPRASLERENHTNEMFKQQRKLSQQRKPSSIDSDFIQETHIDEELWRREVDSVPIEAPDIKIERNGRTRRDTSRREDSIRIKKEVEEKREKKEIRDASVGAPDTKESGCQTRESLFQTETAPSSDGSGSNGRGFSTFGYSGATIARPSPPAPTNTSEITIELLRQVPHQESVKSQKKISDRRPMSSETTRSAPDVIIVSKPIR